MRNAADRLTVSKPALLDQGDDRKFRALLYDFFAFGSSLEAARATFGSHIGLSPTQYLALIAISQAPEDEPVGVSSVARRLQLSGAFVTIEINKLVAEGLVEKQSDPQDGRRVRLRITEASRERLVRLAALQKPVNDALFGALNAEEFDTLAQLMRRLANGGGRAVEIASHLEASLRLEQEAAVASPPSPVGRASGRRSN